MPAYAPTLLLPALLAVLATTAIGASADDTAPGDAPPPDRVATWERQISFGTWANEGNTDKTRINLSLLAEKKGGVNEWRIALEAAYAEADEERTAENASGDVDYRSYITPRVYALLRAQTLYDPVAGIDYRMGMGPGIGWQLLKGPRVDISVESGLSFFWERLDAARDNFAVVRLAERIAWTPAPDLKVWQAVEFMPTVADSGRGLLFAEAGIETLVRRRLGMQLKARMRLDSDPATDKREHDFTYATSFTYRF